MLMRLDCIPPLQGQGYRPTHKYDSQYLHSVNTACIETDGVCRLSQKLCSSIQSYRLNRNICALHHQSTRKRTRRGCRSGKAKHPVTNKKLNLKDTVKFGVLNTRSVRNKTTEFVSVLLDNKFDIIALSESWIKPEDTSVIGNVTPLGYAFLHVPRPGSKCGGGVALIYKTGLNVTIRSTGLDFKSFELLCFDVNSGSVTISIVIIYRPQPKSTGCSFGIFLDEFSSLVDHYLLNSSPILFTGDFNIHVDDTADSEAISFLNLLTASGLQQHIDEPTHVQGHTLDIYITRITDPVFYSNIRVFDGISDHSVISCRLFLKKPPVATKHITSRNLRAIDLDVFCKDIAESDLHNSSDETVDINQQVKQYSDILSGILDKHAPLKTRLVKLRPNTSWYNADIKKEKQKRRQLEHKWRYTRLEIDRSLYLEQKQRVNALIRKAKFDYYNGLLVENAKNQKRLFQIAEQLLHRKQASPLPDAVSNKDLANQFCSFFTEKIKKIREGFQIAEDWSYDEPSSAFHELTCFPLATEDEISNIIFKSKTTSCELDPLPTSLLKKAAHVIVPVITKIVNNSLQSGVFPEPLKIAHVRPLIKKPSLDKNTLKNYRPVSNLSYLGKTIERVALARLTPFLQQHHLNEPYQSAYRAQHSTETALLRVQNDLLCAMDKGKITLLVLLDLSAAFDTVDHKTLLHRMEHRIGINSTALSWFDSYLSKRQQSVCISNESSTSVTLEFGLPQGSCVGPALFPIYTLPLGDIIRKHKLDYHCYADDTQIYLSVDPEQLKIDTAIAKIESCIDDIRVWMDHNYLKLNDAKTEFMIIGSEQQTKKVNIAHIRVGTANIEPSPKIRNLGAMLEPTLTMKSQVNAMTRAASFSIRNIGRIRRFLTKDAAETLVHAFVTSRIDINNSLLFRIPKDQLHRLQRLQNIAARIITYTKPSEHITPILKDLHWLPVDQRIQFKICLMVYKSTNELGPAYLTELLDDYTPRSGLRSCNKGLFVERLAKTQWGTRSFMIGAAKLWNSLPYSLKSSNSLLTFKSNLKTYLFNEAFE